MKNQLEDEFNWKKLSTKGKIWHIIKVILSLLVVLSALAGFLYIMFLVFMMGAAVFAARDVILQDLVHWLLG